MIEPSRVWGKSNETALAEPSLTDRIRIGIERALFEENLKPGDRLIEKDLCARFQTSRTPVREAMLQLAVQGLVEIRPRAGLFVAKATHKQLASMLEVIAEFEGVCARLATRRISAEDRQELIRLQEQARGFATRGDVPGYTQVNIAFHEALYKASANELLADSIRNLRRRLYLYRRNVFDAPGRLKRSCDEHAEVIEMVLAGQEDAAQRAMVNHISQGNQAFIDLVLTVP